MPIEGVYVHSVIRHLRSLNQRFPWFYAHFHWSYQLAHNNNITLFLGGGFIFFSFFLFVLSTHSLNWVFKLSINWPAAVIISTFNWKSEIRKKKKIDSQSYFPIPSIVWMYAYYSMAARSQHKSTAMHLAAPVWEFPGIWNVSTHNRCICHHVTIT